MAESRGWGGGFQEAAAKGSSEGHVGDGPLQSETMLGVVPVFVNAGAALLPAIVAALASVVAVFLKPRELWRICRARPHIPLLVIAVAAGLYFGISWLIAPAAPAEGRKSQAASDRTDWAQVAIRILEDRERARLLGSAASAPAVAAATASPANQGRAMIFRGDPARTGYGGGAAPVKLAAAWRYGEADTMYVSSPAVIGGSVFGASCLLDPPGNYGSVFCLDAASGKPRWVTQTFLDRKSGKEREFKGFFSSPAVSADGKYLVIGQGLHVDADCDLVCLEAATGRLVWRVPTPLHIEGSPAVDGDIAVAGAGAIEGPDHKARGHPGVVLAVRLSDGAKLWECRVNDPESSPVIADGVVYIGSGFNGSAVVALRTATDEELQRRGQDRILWKTATPHPATGAVTLADDLVLIGCGNGDYVFAAANPDGAVIALDRKTGAVRWQVKMPDAVLGPIAVRDGKAICPVRNGEVVALDLKTGGEPRILWRQRVSGRSPILAGPGFTGGLVYAVSQDGYMAVLDAADGKVLEKHYINAEGKPGELGLTVSSPAVVGGRVYVGSETGGVWCFVGQESR